jgi:SAM-dependent methyltransferase
VKNIDLTLNISDYVQAYGGLVQIAKNAFIHRFTDYANIPRPELIDLVPADISTALDVGCGKGQYGHLLKKTRPEIHLTGIEINPTLAHAASPYYNELIIGNIEQLHFDRQVDLINCGDILEHLQNPWAAIEKLCLHLNPGGYLVVSIPNASHWSIIRELSLGNFDYLPAGLLCIGHLRWFTEKSFKEMLNQLGLNIDQVIRHQPTLSPEGEDFVNHLTKLPHLDENALRTHTLYFRATKQESNI